jgi:hypothetical protein
MVLAALFPASFRLSSGDHHFECAAACVQVRIDERLDDRQCLIAEQEKLVWMKQIAEAKNQTPASISTFPTSLEDRPLSPVQSPTRTPTRKSTSPLPFTSLSESITAHKRRFSLGTMDAHEVSPEDSSSKEASEPAPPVPTPSQSDNLATPAQMKTLLEGEMPTILIRRSSTNYRKMVDQCLGDVFSEECQTVRVQAQMKEALFQPPKLTTDAGSALAARNITKRDSILVRRQRSTADAAPQVTTPSPKGGAASKFALVRNKSAHAMGSAKELRRRTLAIPSFSFFEEREESRGRSQSARPNTADSSTPSSQPPTPMEHLAQSDFITFSTRRNRAHRNTIAGQEFLENGSQKESGAIEINALRELNLLKDLPEVPKPKRRSTIMIPSSLRNSEFGNRLSTLSIRRSVERHNSDPLGVPVYSVGQGLSNVEPDHHHRSIKSRLNPGNLIRKSKELINLKRNFSIPSGYFNRSKVNLSALERDDDASLPDRTRSEPPPSPVNHISKSTPAFQDALTAWELVPSMKLSRPDNKRAPSLGSASSTDYHARAETPPVPPLPLYAQTLQASKSSLRRRSSQFIQHHLGKLNNPTPTNT